jgi:dipeptidyl aminopeptidase/acylaminoacyl peptidase
LASDDGVIVVSVDGRGTGGRGLAFMTSVYRRLGYYEAVDVHTTILYLQGQPYVDAKRIGLQGWSYGGYLSLKALESDIRQALSVVISVAPVINWRLYDSIYTERHMDLLASNLHGYNESAVHVTAAFHHAKLLVIQGSVDDNVHMQNFMYFQDDLIAKRIGLNSTLESIVVPDDDHMLNKASHGAYVWMKMNDFVRRAWDTKKIKP